eukprot:scaffold16164_cov186-Skeletonema_dohrnii-CCMP3373.AAC.2
MRHFDKTGYRFVSLLVTLSSTSKMGTEGAGVQEKRTTYLKRGACRRAGRSGCWTKNRKGCAAIGIGR